MRKSRYFPFLMFSAKQGNYWYHFCNVFGMTRSLTGDWTGDLGHSKPALYTVIFLVIWSIFVWVCCPGMCCQGETKDRVQYRMSRTIRRAIIVLSGNIELRIKDLFFLFYTFLKTIILCLQNCNYWMCIEVPTIILLCPTQSVPIISSFTYFLTRSVIHGNLLL